MDTSYFRQRIDRYIHLRDAALMGDSNRDSADIVCLVDVDKNNTYLASYIPTCGLCSKQT